MTKTRGAAKSVRREDEMPIGSRLGHPIGSSSAWADVFRPSLSVHRARSLEAAEEGESAISPLNQ